MQPVDKGLGLTVEHLREVLDYDTPEEAHVAYIDAAQRLHGEFANAGGP